MQLGLRDNNIYKVLKNHGYKYTRGTSAHSQVISRRLYLRVYGGPNSVGEIYGEEPVEGIYQIDRPPHSGGRKTAG